MNLSETNNKLYGVADGISYGQNARVDELNGRSLARFNTDIPLRPNIEFRSVPTKYARFPLIDRRTEAKVPIKQYPVYSTETSFSPMQSRGPVDGFDVASESVLRNQYFALQRAPQAEYIPDSTSDLYKTTVPNSSNPVDQPFPGLFDRYSLNTIAPIRNMDPKVGADTFLNNTRTQLRGGALSV